MNNNFLSDVLSKEQFTNNKMNLIIAKTGQGKTRAATKTLPKMLGVDRTRVLFLIDTNAGEANLDASGDFQQWGEEQKNKIYLMNYAKFGWLLQQHKINSEMFDLIVCDEFHNLYKYARIDEATMWHRNPSFDRTTISLMLSRESTSYRAMETLKRWVEMTPIWIFALTATPQQFLNRDAELMAYIHEVQYNEGLVVRDIVSKYTYTDANKILTESTPNKRLLFATTVGQAKDFAETINNETDRKAIALWSKHNETPMTDEQLQVRKYIMANEEFPKDIDDIVATEAYATGWNLNDERVNEVIVHTGNEIIQEQFSGRLRHNIEKLYIYDAEAAKKAKRIARRQVNKTEKFKIPKKYLDKWLTSTERNALIKEINFPKKWTSLGKWLEENGYKVDKDTHGNRRISK